MLPETLKSHIISLGRSCGAERIVLFGSRARGDNRPRSDIDLAVFGLPTEQETAFWSGIDELPTLLKFDIVFVRDYTAPALLENIAKDSIVLMDKFKEKLEKYQRSVLRLGEIIQKYDECQMEELKDGVIQRFSFCSELAWKTTREYLLDQGFVDINSPKSVMCYAYESGLISNESAWISLLKARNLTSHVYDEETVNIVFEQIRANFLPLFRDLEKKLGSA